MKKKVFKTRLIKTFMVMLCFFSLFISSTTHLEVYASNKRNETLSFDEELAKRMQVDIGVTAEIEDGFSIFIPKQIIVRCGNLEERYDISIVGDLNNNKYIIVPEEEIVVKNANEKIIIAYIKVEEKSSIKNNIQLEGKVFLDSKNSEKLDCVGKVNFNILTL